MTPHTPGPWKAGGETLNYVYSNGTPICRVMIAREDWKANARLIAAAPQLLEALQNLERMISARPTSDFDWQSGSEDRAKVEAAREALAAATGEVK